MVSAMLIFTGGASAWLRAQPPDAAVLHIAADRIAAHVSPMLYGLMTEEINFSYDGGLYAELIRNRNFKEDAKEAVHWRLVQYAGSGSMSLDPSEPLSDAVPASLKLTVAQTAGPIRVGVANDGFWGIPVKPDTRYRASFYAKASAGFKGPLTVAIAGNNGAAVYATAQVARITVRWRKYEVALKTGNVAASVDNQFIISSAGPRTIWFGLVSLFPPTWNNRPNGNCKDIMELLADMKPAFLRFPGGRVT